MNMGKTVNSNTAAGVIKAAQDAAAGVHTPPAHVRVESRHLPFWTAIMKSKTRDEWSDADLIVAAQLARCQFEIEEATEQLEREGPVIENQRGTPIMNPLQSVLEQLSRRQLALMRAIRLAGTASEGAGRPDPATASERRKAARQAGATADAGVDDLLA